MNELQRPTNFVPAGEPDADGLFFIYHFAENGLKTDSQEEAAWTWRSYMLNDLHARQAIAGSAEIPVAAKEAFLSNGYDCHVDLDEGWMHGDLPDLRHDYSAEARGLGHFRFAFNDKMLIGARKQPLDSVEFVRKQIEAKARAFKSPAALIEAVTDQSLNGMSRELTQLSDTLDGIEDRIVCDAWHNERQTLTDARRRLVTIHRQMATLASLFKHLDHSHHDDMPPAMADMVARLSHRAMSLHHDGEQLQARARLLQDELMAKLSAQSNKLLYLLSVMTAVLLPMTIISGLFGMNVGGLPFIHSGLGFWVVSLISLGVAGTTLFFVRRLGDGM